MKGCLEVKMVDKDIWQIFSSLMQLTKLQVEIIAGYVFSCVFLIFFSCVLFFNNKKSVSFFTLLK